LKKLQTSVFAVIEKVLMAKSLEILGRTTRPVAEANMRRKDRESGNIPNAFIGEVIFNSINGAKTRV